MRACIFQMQPPTCPGRHTPGPARREIRNTPGPARRPVGGDVCVFDTSRPTAAHQQASRPAAAAHERETQQQQQQQQQYLRFDLPAGVTTPTHTKKICGMRRSARGLDCVCVCVCVCVSERVTTHTHTQRNTIEITTNLVRRRWVPLLPPPLPWCCLP
jgi:hypothetical protein